MDAGVVNNCKSETVLVVDDNPMVVRVIHRALSVLGYDVLCCTDSVEALRLFLARPQAISAVITDQSMPVLKGLDMACEMLRAKPELPIILCTGLEEDVDERTARAAGIEEFLLKPFSIKTLDSILRRLLANDRHIDYAKQQQGSTDSRIA